jgi:hypothetical protein
VVLVLLHALDYCDIIVAIIFLERHSFDSISSLLIILWMSNLNTCYLMGYCTWFWIMVLLERLWCSQFCRGSCVELWLWYLGSSSIIIYLSKYHILFSVLVSRLRTYCTGHGSGMGLSEFSNGSDAWSEQGTGDGSLGATRASKSSCRVSTG